MLRVVERSDQSWPDLTWMWRQAEAAWDALYKECFALDTLRKSEIAAEQAAKAKLQADYDAFRCDTSRAK